MADEALSTAEDTVSTGTSQMALTIIGFSALLLVGAALAIRELPRLTGTGLEQMQAVAETSEPIEVSTDESIDEAELLKQQLAERERIDREEVERERLWREEDERWEAARAERQRQEAADERHAQILAEQRRQSTLIEQQHRERMAQQESIAKAQARAERVRQAKAERRHREELAQMKKNDRTARKSNGVANGAAGRSGILPNKTERMFGDGPGLFEQD